jgi:hypothetical protein
MNCVRPSCKVGIAMEAGNRGITVNPSGKRQLGEESPVPPGNFSRSSIEAVLQFCGSALDFFHNVEEAVYMYAFLNK